MMSTATSGGVKPSEFVLEVSGLEVSYENPVLHDVGFTLAPGERLALVGQSGSGKSTTISAVLGLLPGAGHVSSGSVKYRGEDLVHADRQRLQTLRGRSIALVPQDPMASLNPSMRVGDQIADALRTYGMSNSAEVTRNVVRLMTEAGIPDAENRRRSYPHEFSGGMRQRILIAIALSGEPDLIIADEPTSALDVTVQKQILDHLQKLVTERGTSLLFVTHDLGVAGERTDTILVMNEGRSRRTRDTAAGARESSGRVHEGSGQSRAQHCGGAGPAAEASGRCCGRRFPGGQRPQRRRGRLSECARGRRSAQGLQAARPQQRGPRTQRA